jgi:hypothetical protein
MTDEQSVFAFDCNVKGTDWHTIVNARTAGQAMVDYWRDVRESWPSIPYTAIRCRKVGRPQSSEMFQHVARIRGVAGLQCGQRVHVGAARGVLVGAGSGANFEVLFDGDSPKYANQRLFVHPSELRVEG